MSDERDYSDNPPSPEPETVEDRRAVQIEEKISFEQASDISVDGALGSLRLRDMAQVFNYAKGMALSGPMVPSFLRNRPWSCFGIAVQAIEWRMSPFALAREAYEVENAKTGERTVAYTSKVQHAVIEARAPIKERLKVRYEGTGDDMVCVVSGTFKGETEPREWRSERLGDRRPKPQERTNRRDGSKYTVTPGSPLWQTKPTVQLFYDTSRDWIRIYAPDVAMGLFGDDELSERGFEPTGPKLPPPGGGVQAPEDGGLSARLTEASIRKMGFTYDAGRVAAEIDGNGVTADNSGSGAAGPEKPTVEAEPPRPLVAAEADSPAADGGQTPVEPSAAPSDAPEGPSAVRDALQASVDLLGDKPRQRASKRNGRPAA